MIASVRVKAALDEERNERGGVPEPHSARPRTSRTARLTESVGSGGPWLSISESGIGSPGGMLQPGSYGEDFTFLRLFFCGIGDNDTTGCLFLFCQATNNETVL